MYGSSPAQRLADDRDRMDHQPYLSTHRALAACTRELGRLTEDVMQRVGALHAEGIDERAIVRQSPNRCIVQLGPVALTMAWLRGSPDLVASGELLVIVWQGAVARREERYPERAPTGVAPSAATSLWEEVLRPEGESEASWTWQTGAADTAGCSSADLAVRCVERLCAAYSEVHAAS